ncbi:ribosome maturation factor RimP [Alphaproteobacteria bacterium]|nr:ribosome maturation factor RimP [Alphaproteobacteria bacterium]
MSPLENKIVEIVSPVIEDLGYTLVQVKMTEGALQIMAENSETRNLGVEDCRTISKAVSAVMDVEDPISGAYTLEVSSPGIDRPLTRLEDFEMYQGFEAKVECKIPTENGQKKFRGVIQGLDGEMIEMNTDQGDAFIPFSSISKAKLILTDDLIKQTART